jgi:malonyl-CoA O-methyltransferase
MSGSSTSTNTARAIDRAALLRWQQRQALAAEPPWLHGEVARRMAERLQIMKRVPTVVIDWWSRSGASSELLRAAYPKAQQLRVEPAAVMQQPPKAAAPWWSAQRWRSADAVAESSVPDGQAQLLWANMMLHAVADPGALLAQWRRALSMEGFVMFSTLGPDTLRTLRETYREAGWGVAHAPFVDMHDLGDMLVRAGFADPVMDQEMLRLTWATPAALRAELRSLGLNADPARCAGLRTPRWRARLDAALVERAHQHTENDGRIALEFEIIYGHAFNPPPRLAVAGETRLSAADLQRMARTGRNDASLG